VKGNLYSRDGSSPFVSTIGTYNVRIEMQTSNLIDQVSISGGGGGGGNSPTPAEIWSHLIEGGLTAEQMMRIMSAVLAGKLSGGAGPTVAIRDLADTKNRIVATVDANGNRTAVSIDPS
jgi:hypothetical protein